MMSRELPHSMCHVITYLVQVPALVPAQVPALVRVPIPAPALAPALALAQLGLSWEASEGGKEAPHPAARSLPSCCSRLS